MSLRIESFDDLSLLDDRSRWEELFGASGTATPFQSASWQSSWWATLGRRKKPLTAAILEGDDLIAVMPLAVTDGPWRTIRFACTGVSDYLWPLVRTGYEVSANRMFGEWLGEQHADLIDLHQVREGHPLLPFLSNAEFVQQAECCVLDLPDSYERYVEGLSKSLRYDVRSLGRGKFASGEASLRPITRQEDVIPALGAFFRLHAQRWKKRGLPGAFAFSSTQALHEKFAPQALEAGILKFTLLEARGEPVGAIYALSSSSTYFFYQSGFDPEHKALNPGTVLVAHTIRQAIDEGASTFDFLRGAEAYKLRWKPQNTYKNVRAFFAVSGARGKLGRSWNRMASKIEGKVRGRLEGKGLLG